jgi:hypothetical protein
MSKKAHQNLKFINHEIAARLIMPENDDDTERILLSRSKKLKAIVKQSRAAAKQSEVVSLEEAFG